MKYKQALTDNQPFERPSSPPLTSPLANQTTVFCILWAIAHLGHLLRKANPSDPIAWLLMAAAVLLLARPSSRIRLGALAAIQITYLGTQIPWTDNHMYLMGFVNMGLLTAVLTSLWPGAQNDSRNFLLPRLYIFATLLLSYGAAAVAKLNAGFFDPETSCAVTMFYDAIAVFGLERDGVPDVVRSLDLMMPTIITAIELMVPILLLIPRTRRAGVVLVVLFHWAVSLSPTATALDFTLVLFALVILFLPVTAANRIYIWAQRTVAVFPVFVRPPFFVLLSLFLTISLVLGPGSVPGNRNWIWLAATALVLGLLLLQLAFTERDSSSTPIPSGRLSLLGMVPYAAFVFLQLANISAPYLGSKNVGSFVMYSNLQTERRHSNHFLLPRLPMDMGQDDLVEIVDSSSEWLRHVRDSGRLISWHELRRHLSYWPDTSLTYKRGDRLFSYQRAGDNPELVRRHPVAHRLIGHRLYDLHKVPCRW